MTGPIDATAIVLSAEALSVGLILFVTSRTEASYRRIVNSVLAGASFFTCATLSELLSYGVVPLDQALMLEAYFYAAGFASFLILGVRLAKKPAKNIEIGKGIFEFYGGGG